MLIEQDMQPIAFLIAREFLDTSEALLYNDFFKMVPKDLSKNKIIAEAHMDLLGEDILKTKKKLKGLKKIKEKEA